jgi:hypothetical protein
MFSFLTRRRCVRWLALLGLSVVALPLPSADGQPPHVQKNNAPANVVDMFTAIEQGQIKVQFFPRDATQARLVVTNETDQPISVTLPPAFAGTPVLAQFNNPLQAKTKAPQPLGVAPAGNPAGNNMPGIPNFNNPIGRNNGGGPNIAGLNPLGAMFNIPPEKVEQVKLKAVCLQMDRPTPNAHCAYEVKPLAAVCDKPELYEICRLLSDPGVSQKALQAAAWHYANGLSWEQLATKRAKWLPNTSYFSKSEIEQAKKLAEAAAKKVEGQKGQPSPGSAGSSTPHQ